ncbi:DUF1697 domain-containing protein [Pontixanthobacter gangjinensis]|uniref:DUF1697 domain-containing protein n=1 Tax=Pontixanthobacter gangjinensis TaxID=1028742 RepID=A0A6I4SP45_9SPHN|nr:DUF1697 domain-containing protein [Pontixanthobacter gangjinensis]MXO57731.1 DUF1697 domain-containing protein [Pontixanthobacter gangjinensis]
MRYVAFLGSINVGGNRLLMEDLRRVLRYEDFDDVETVVASGNVLFTHAEGPSEGIAEKLAWTVNEEFDIESFVAVRTRDELAATIAENPFAEDGEDNFVHTMFLADEPGEFAVKSLVIDHEGRGNERIAAGTKALHVDYADGVARSKLTGDFIQRRLGLSGTARNMRSMKRILAKMDELDA